MAYISKVTAGGSTYNVGSNLYGTCDTAAGTAAKVAVVSGFDTLETGVTVHIKFTYSNTVASPTLAIKPTSSGTATTAKSIMRYGTTAPSTSAKTSWQAGSVVSFTYDGTYWQMNGWLNDDSTYTVNNGKLTVQKNGATVATFTANQSGDSTANITVPTAVSELTNDSGYTTNTGTITGVKTTAGTHSTIDVSSGAANFNVPTKTSHLTNDSGFLTAHQTIKQDGVTGATVNRFGTCSTAAATAAKTVSITTGTFALEAGATIAVKFSNANTANNPTLAVNSTAAKNIFVNGAQITSGGNKALLTGTVVFVYDGTQWNLIGNYYDTNTQTVTGVKGNSESSYRTGNVNITAANIGLGNVENKSSATIRGELTSSNVTTALGYTPPTSDTNNAVTQTATAANANYEVLFSGTADNTTRTEGARKSSGFIYNPSNESILVGSLKSNTTLGTGSSAFGYSNEASGYYSHAEGYSTTASGSYSHAEGSETTTSGNSSHAEGSETTASGGNAHAEGYSTTASGVYSHAEGSITTASGDGSHAEGYGTTANHAYQHVFGRYNIADNSSAGSSMTGNYIEIVGNGTSSNALSNARTLDWSGNETIAGNLTLSGSSSDISFTGTHKWDGINASLNTTLGAKLNKSGGEITGTVYSQTNGSNFEVYSPNSGHKMRFTATDTPRSGLYDMIASRWAFWKNADGEYQIGPNGYAVQSRTQAQGTTKYPLRDGVVFAFRSGASSNTVTVACVSQWSGDSVIYQHHVSTINVTVDTWHETIKVANNTNGNIQVIMIGQFNDNSTY